MSDDKKPDHVCEDCGGHADEKRACAYNEGMGGLRHEVWLCLECYQKREYEL